MKAIEIEKPSLFPSEKVICGITKSNYSLFPDGFSIFPGKTLTDERVEFFREVLAENLSTKRENLVFQKQVHGSEVREIKGKQSDILISDGMICNTKSIILNVTVADCVGVMLYDPTKEAIAALHSGWRGTVENISGKGIKKMISIYGTNPNDLLAWLSPAAGCHQYEVGKEVADLFPTSVKKEYGNKFLLDVRQRIFEQLIQLGVQAENIEKSEICTIENVEFHSYRRDGDRSGRMSVFIGMRE